MFPVFVSPIQLTIFVDIFKQNFRSTYLGLCEYRPMLNKEDFKWLKLNNWVLQMLNWNIVYYKNILRIKCLAAHRKEVLFKQKCVLISCVQAKGFVGEVMQGKIKDSERWNTKEEDLRGTNLLTETKRNIKKIYMQS